MRHNPLETRPWRLINVGHHVSRGASSNTVTQPSFNHRPICREVEERSTTLWSQPQQRNTTLDRYLREPPLGTARNLMCAGICRLSQNRTRKRNSPHACKKKPKYTSASTPRCLPLINRNREHSRALFKAAPFNFVCCRRYQPCTIGNCVNFQNRKVAR